MVAGDLLTQRRRFPWLCSVILGLTAGTLASAILCGFGPILRVTAG